MSRRSRTSMRFSWSSRIARAFDSSRCGFCTSFRNNTLSVSS